MFFVVVEVVVVVVLPGFAHTTHQDYAKTRCSV